MSIPWVRPGYGYRSSVVEQVGVAPRLEQGESHMSQFNRSSSGFAVSRAILASLVIVGAALFSATAHAAITLTPAGTAQGLILTTFSSGYPQGDGVGPLGIGFTSSNGVMVSDKFGDIRLFPTNADGQVAPAATQHYGNVTGSGSFLSNATGIAQVGNNIYLARQGVGDVVQVNQNGSLNQVIVTGLPYVTGIVANPNNGHLYVSTLGMNAVFEVDPIAKTKTLFTNGDIDGLALSSNGSTLYSLNEDTGMITGYSTTTGAVTFAPLFVSTQIDGAVQGLPTLGNNLFVNTRDGKIIEVNLTTRAETTIADGGSRGDFASVDRINNTLLFTQSDSIVRLSLAQVSAVPLPPGIWAGAVTALGGIVISRRRAGKRASVK